MKHKKIKRKAKPLLWILAAALIAGIAWGGYSVYQNEARKKEAQEVFDSLTLTVDEDALRVDCGAPFDIASAVQYSEGKLETEGTIDTSKVGSYPVSLILKKDTSYGETISRSYPVTVEVIDATVPEITFKEEAVEVHTGAEDMDLYANIISVTDGKDGDLTQSEGEAAGSYWAETNVDFNTPGEYTVTVTALDFDGHRISAEYRLVVSEVSAAVYPYRIRINRELNTVTVYSADADGNYTIPLKAMVCSTGGATPVGIFHTFNRSTWRALFGGVYGQYATDIVGDILFHSVPYYSMNKGDVEYLEYNKLGTKASMGCIRLAVIDALWIFENCPIGTEVEIYDDPADPGPLGKPEPIYIDPESPIRGWDPTDPDPANPWNG